MTDQWLHYVSSGLLLVGSFFAVLGGIGILRLPDFYSRTHAGSITDTMGAGLILLGLMVLAGPTAATIKLVMIMLFLFMTSPTACHALSSSARIHLDTSEPIKGGDSD